MTPARAIWLFCAVVLAGIVWVLFDARRHYDPVAALTAVYDTELAPDSNRARWWIQSARCLGLDTVYDAKLRYFTGDTIPASWGTPPTGEVDGFANTHDHLILLGPGWTQDSALIVHEQLHDHFQNGAHPSPYFSGRCGVAPGRN